jgi:hypothetical protein
MIIFDQEKLSAFFKTVSRGFERSPLEVILVIVSVLVFIALLIIAYRIQRRRIRRQQRSIADRRYKELAEKRLLTPSEQNLVKRMARFLKDPVKKYLILISQPTFNFCASKLRKKESVSASSIAELRNRLGFRLQGPEQIPASSAELPDGQGLLIISIKGNLRAQGRVGKQEPRAMVVELVEGSPAFREREAIRVYFQNRSGLFSFDSIVQSVQNRTVLLAHGEEIKRIQRRKYYRKRISQPVAVRRPDSEEQHTVSTFYDLGGNGASLKNPQKRFSAGEDLELTFLAAGERFTLVAEVLRTSKNGEVLHVRFAPMRESTRDRIIGALFKGAGTPLRQGGP